MKKMIALLLALLLTLGLFAGCGSTADTASTAPAADAGEVAEAAEAAEANEAPVEDYNPLLDSSIETDPCLLPDNYPMISEEGMTLTMLQSTNPNLAELITDYNDLPFWTEVTARTGISFDWNMVAFASAEEQFNLLCAADDLPNITCVANYYSDGIASAIENNVFVDLSEYLDSYAPDYKKVIAQPDVYPAISDEDGGIMAFYQIGMEEFVPNNGVLIRGDLLEEQGLEVPITYDDTKEVLLKLKDAYNIEAPIFHYTDNDQWLTAGKGVKTDFSLDADGNCIYGPYEEAYREYLKVAGDWYAEGLIYRDFYTIPSGQNIGYMINYMSTGQSVITFGYCEFANMIELGEGQYFSAGYIPRDDANAQVHLTAGVDAKVALGVCYGIGTNSTPEEIEAACMLMNYFYTEEGALFANYGVEGQGFEYREDGTPWYTEMITANPDGLTMTQALCFYIGYMVPAHADYTKYNIASLTTWADFVDAWGTADNSYQMPNVSLTADETERYSAIASDVSTYLDEELVKFIIGDKDVNDDAVWEAYIADLDSLGVPEMIEIYSDALARYNARAVA